MTKEKKQNRIDPAEPVLDGIPGDISPENLEFLRSLIDSFNASTGKLRAAYDGLREKVDSLNLRLEETNRDLSMSLAEQERLSNYLTNILESLSSGVLVIDTDGRLTLFNRGAESITGITVGEAMNKPYREIMGYETVEELTPLWTLSTGEGHAQIEKTIVSKTGKAIPVGCSVSPLRNAAGEMIGAVEIFMDLTRIKALEDELAHKEKLAALGQMAATMAHKIRNPLGGIAGFSGLLDLEIRDNDNGRRLVKKITEGVDKIERIVTSLLSYTSPLVPDTQTVDLVDLMRDCTVSAAAGHDTVKVTVDDADGPVLAEVDTVHFRKAALNILLNAVESIDEAGTVTVTVLAEIPGHDTESSLTEKVLKAIDGTSGVLRSALPAVCIIVTDTGAGMDSETRERLFVPFFTTKENGIGLGLAHAAKIIEAHRGEIFIESEMNHGTAVGIVIPAKRALGGGKW